MQLQQNGKTKNRVTAWFLSRKKIKLNSSSGWSDLSSIVHWGLINVSRKPENPESDSWGAGVSQGGEPVVGKKEKSG